MLTATLLQGQESAALAHAPNVQTQQPSMQAIKEATEQAGTPG